MKTLILFLGLAGMITATSCEKCSKCDGGGLSTEGSFCSKDNGEVDDFEDACRLAGGEVE